MPIRDRFDATRDFVAARGFLYNGHQYAAGDSFDKSGIVPHRLRTLYESRAINQLAADAVAAAPSGAATMTPEKGGYYTVRAPWIEDERVRGKAAAEKRVAELNEEGAPLGFIAGGTEVVIEELGGGWYAVSAPWTEGEPEKVQGREDAERVQRRIHVEGEPATHHGYTLTEGENGWYEISGESLEEPEKVHGEEAARARALELRSAEPTPEGDTGAPEGAAPPPAAPAAPEGTDGAEEGAQAATEPAAAPTGDDTAPEAAAAPDGEAGAEQTPAADGSNPTTDNTEGSDMENGKDKDGMASTEGHNAEATDGTTLAPEGTEPRTEEPTAPSQTDADGDGDNDTDAGDDAPSGQ